MRLAPAWLDPAVCLSVSSLDKYREAAFCLVMVGLLVQPDVPWLFVLAGRIPRQFRAWHMALSAGSIATQFKACSLTFAAHCRRALPAAQAGSHSEGAPGAVLDPVLHLTVRRGSADVNWHYRGDNLEIVCQGRNTAAEVKGQIEEQSGLAADTFKLVFNGQVRPPASTRLPTLLLLFQANAAVCLSTLATQLQRC